MRKRWLITSLLCSTLLFAACGDDETEENEADVEETDELESDGQLRFDDAEYIEDVNFSTLLRDPDEYSPLPIEVTGDVVQVVEGFEDDFTMYLMNRVEDEQGKTGQMFFVFIETEYIETNLIEDDRVQVQGIFTDTYTYETTGGITSTVPLVYLQNAHIWFNAND